MRLTKVDRRAMERAISQMREQGGEDKRQIEDMLQDRPWTEVGRFAAYSRQSDTLHLRLWETPPCWLIDDADVADALAMPPSSDEHAAGELVQRLLACGLSKFEPDLPGALERAEAAAEKKRPAAEHGKAVSEKP